MTRARYAAALVAILAIDLGLTWIEPSADPPSGYSADHSLSIDGHWYAAEAREWSTGVDNATHADYRQPLFSAPAWLFFETFGVSYASSRAVSSLASVLTILLLAHLVRERYGAAAALFAAAILATHPAWHAFVRSPVVYPWLAFWFLAVLAIASRRHRAAPWIAAALAVVVALGLKTLIAVALPALVVELAVRARSRHGARAALRVGSMGAAPVAAAALLALALWPELGIRLAWYVRGLGQKDIAWWTRATQLEERSHLFSAAPMLVVATVIGAASFLTRVTPAHGGSRRFERLFHATFWPLIAAFAFSGYTPLRYLLMFIPGMCYVAAGCVHALVERHRSRALPLGGARGIAAGLLASLGIIFISGQLVVAARDSTLPATGAAIAGTLLVLGALAVWRTSRARRAVSVPLLIIGLVVVVLVVHGARWRALIAETTFSLESASREVAAILPAGARLVGPFAHAVSVENALYAEQVNDMRFGSGNLRRLFAGGDWSHLVTYRPPDPSWYARFSADGVEVSRVATLWIRGTPVDVIRIGTSTIAPSLYEEARRALDRGDARAAARAFRACIGGHPRSGLAWAGFGEALLAQGDVARAAKALEHALGLLPDHAGTRELLERLHRDQR